MGSNMLECSNMRKSISSPNLTVLLSANQVKQRSESEGNEKLEALRVKKEALESALSKKLFELKSLCLKEGVSDL